MITILGPTASGKTTLAVYVARGINAEIISADSRQVYRGMDIGTGKDLSEYSHGGSPVPYHLIDICEAGEEYNVFRFTGDFARAFEKITSAQREVILCGGTGMYLDAVLFGYNMVEVPADLIRRTALQSLDAETLRQILFSLGSVHATSDLKDKERTIVAIEKRMYHREHHLPERIGAYPSAVFGIDISRDHRRDLITRRLHQRIEEGMVDEVETLISNGVSVKQLMAYGLEYKWVATYLTGQCTREDMITNLNTAIHRFAKRQMTWFRRMEKMGLEIHWLQASMKTEEKFNVIIEKLNKRKA